MHQLNLKTKKITLLSKLTLSVFLLLCMIACGNPNESSNSAPQKIQGTSDGGGGIIAGSTKEEVKEAIYRVRERIANLFDVDYEAYIKELNVLDNNDDGYKVIEITRKILQERDFSVDDDLPNSFVRKITIRSFNSKLQKLHRKLFLAKQKKQENETTKIKAQIEEVLNERSKYRQTISNEKEKIRKNFSKFLMGIELEILNDRACHSKDKNHTDASVSKNTLDATICFSLKKLTRIPKITLEEHIAGLWFHELSHMTGHNETDSQNMEKVGLAISRNFLSPTSYEDEYLHIAHNQGVRFYSFTMNILNFLGEDWVDNQRSRDSLRRAHITTANFRNSLAIFSENFNKAIHDIKIGNDKDQIDHIENILRLFLEISDIIELHYDEPAHLWTLENLKKLAVNSNELGEYLSSLKIRVRQSKKESGDTSD